MAGWRFDNTYTRLPAAFFAPATPAWVRGPRVAVLNLRLGDELGLDLRSLPPEDAAALFAGQTLPSGSQPIAQAYAGHQYGHGTMLGDGRAILLGEHRTPAGHLVDIQFKGSGPTRFSRRGDGLAALVPMLREYIISEAMAALGIPTTRSLAVVTTGEPVFREGVRKGAILTRVAASHIRVGTFEYAAALEDVSVLRSLTDYTIARHDPDLADAPDKFLAFLSRVIDRQASLVARWMQVGFVHGVMNTDNVAVSGETIDYGPCAFLDEYHPDTVFSSIDQFGRYAYGNQPRIMQWNLARFAESLLPLLADEPKRAVEIATAALNEYPGRYEAYWLAGMRAKLGLATAEDGDAALVQELLDTMATTKADFTNTFRDLSEGKTPDGPLGEWNARWRARQQRDGRPLDVALAAMRAVNPAIIPRNHRVEEALAAAENDDLSPLHEMVAALSTPFDPPASADKYRQAPPPGRCYRTFCGT